ncbi:MAG: hypothetical protein JNM07_07310 [Phycisphaerae bacterium]|nr:hypothetical protein [Phycisphaerae bacterium]
MAGCASNPDQIVRDGDRGNRVVTLEDLRIDGRLPAIKPEGLVLRREHGDEEDTQRESGPPPYGYIKIIGEPDPNWSPTPITKRGPNLSWSFIGPRPMASEYWSGEGNAGGHIADIAPHPTDPNICYIAADTGGIWRTVDGGANWAPLTDTLSIMNHGAVALDPQNPSIVYAGTGSYNAGTSGDGLFRSTDAGATWNRIGTTSQVGSQITDIVVHPTISSTIHLTGSSGYRRSTDNGATWSLRLGSACTSLAVHPTTPNTLYVGRNGQGVYRSTDGGTTLTKLAGGLPASGFSAVYVGLAKSNPNVLYTVFVNGGGILGLYRSADGGTTWTQKAATPNFPNPQGNWNCYLAVSPTNENTVFAGGVDPRYATSGIIRTTDGGDTWTEISDGPSQVHPDHHCMAFGPVGVIWEGNDGGIYKSTNNGDNWTNLNATLGAAQIYNLVQHPTLTNRALGGTQDNGTPERTSSSFSWSQLQVGDGGFSVIDPSTSTNRRYTTYVYLAITRWTGSSAKGISGPWGSDPVNFIAPLVGDPNTANNLLGGTNRVWRTTNATATTPAWAAISTTSNAAGGTINAIAVAKGASNTIYSGSSTGKVYVTTDAANWADRSAGLPSGQISDLVISPTNPAVAYVTFYNTTGARVLRTDNAGVSWTNVTGTLPSGVRANALAVDWDYDLTKPSLYIGAGAGMYFSLDGGAAWTKSNATLPNVNVADLFIDPVARVLVAGTYGRGAWRAGLIDPCPADFNADGSVDDFDYFDFLNALNSVSPAADFNGDTSVDDFDYFDFLNAFNTPC